MALKLRGYDYTDEPDDVQTAGGFELGGGMGNSGGGEGLFAEPPGGGEGDNSLLRINPGSDPRIGARSEEKPRDRDGGSVATPRRPPEPTPHTGASMVAGGPSGGPAGLSLRPFTPMADVGSGDWQGSGGLFGSLGGLRGGGLGRPLDPMANEQSSISALIQMLLRGGGQV